MNENELDNIESQNDAEETVNQEVEVDPTIELRAQLKSMEAQKNHWRDKANEEPKEAKVEETPKESLSELAQLRKDLAATQLLAKGYSSAEQEVITTAANELGISPLDASEKKYIIAEVNELREARRVAEATPAPTDRSGTQKLDAQSYIDKDEMPEDPEMIREMIKKLAGKPDSYQPLPTYKK